MQPGQFGVVIPVEFRLFRLAGLLSCSAFSFPTPVKIVQSSHVNVIERNSFSSKESTGRLLNGLDSDIYLLL